MGKELVFSSIALVMGILLPVYADAAQADTQKQIIAQKEQEQASKRAEYNLQHSVSQSMAKIAAAVKWFGCFCYLCILQ